MYVSFPMALFRALLLIIGICFPVLVPAHPGGLDSNCGHHNRKAGEYHYHVDWKSCRNLSIQAEAAESKSLQAVDGRVLRVKDGDTVVIQPEAGGEAFVCRLYGIDTPEKARRGRPGQPHAAGATKELKALILGKLVQAYLTGDKTYGREVCIIYNQGMNINLEMVKRGYAWAYRRYLERPYASEFIDAERQAREKELGIWQDSNPIPPWEFRRMAR
jgi:micrococcal nuclease